MTPPSILVVDDDSEFRRLVATLLGDIGCRIVEAADRDQALAAVDAERPRLVLVDVHLPGMSGYDICLELRDRFGSQLPIVFISGTRTEPIDRAGGLLLGADDYIVKPFDAGEFVARVRRFLRNRGTDGADNLALGAISRLTPREREVLDHLAEGENQIEIAEALFISPKTVAGHIQRVLAKLDVRSRAEAVALVLRSHSHQRDVEAHADSPLAGTA
jgi:DNA-binding response OmpR family regulator